MGLYFIYFGVIVFVFILGVIRFGVLSWNSKIILILLFITIISELIATFLSKSGSSNILVYHIFMPLEFSILCLAFKNQVSRILIDAFIVIFIGFSFFNSLFIQNFRSEFNSNAFVLYCILVLILSVIFLFNLLKMDGENSFKDYPLFWISIGFTLFCLVNLFILGTHNVLAENNKLLARIFTNIRFISNYFLYLLFIPAFLNRQCEIKI